MSHGDDLGPGSRSPGRGAPGQTRTRLPEGDSDPYGARRTGRSSTLGSRGLVTVVAVVVLLIAAIAFANRSGNGGSQHDGGGSGGAPKAAATAASGTRPVGGKSSDGIPTGYAHDQQGAQSAAANYAVALGSADMFDRTRRNAILDTVVAPSSAASLKDQFDKAYTPAFDKAVGLDADGSAPDGYTFVSRTNPIGSRPKGFTADRGTVSVWCGGLVGLAGEKSTTPVTDTWFTLTMTLTWTSGDWKVAALSQKDGPTPVPGDQRSSRSDEISQAVEGYGGFTYAR